MSATLSNPNLLADWLQARFYVSKYQRIPIEEHLVYDNAIYPTANAKECFQTASQLSRRTPSTQKPVTPCATIDKSKHHDFENSVTNAVVTLSAETAVVDVLRSRMGDERMAALDSRLNA
jgi:superfamily II RNA helicase